MLASFITNWAVMYVQKVSIDCGVEGEGISRAQDGLKRELQDGSTEDVGKQSQEKHQS